MDQQGSANSGSASAAINVSRREFISAAAVGTAAVLGATSASGGETVAKPTRTGLPPGAPLAVQPVLVYALPKRVEKTSWRGYGGLRTQEEVQQESVRIEKELQTLVNRAEFPIKVLPVKLVGSAAETQAAAKAECDTLLVYASGGDLSWLEQLGACGKPNVMFLRHKSGPIYLWYEIAHWRLLRKHEDVIKEANITIDDIVVDEYSEVLWRLRALYGLKNTRGTKSIAIGGLAAYSGPGQKFGPDYARKTWGFELIPVADTLVAERVQRSHGDAQLMQAVERETEELLAQPNVVLRTERKFVVNSIVALRVFKDIMKEHGAANLGVAHCMGSLIKLLDTPPCLVLGMLNDEGYTAFCHTDYTHTPPGVLLRWISGKPSFVNNSHFPHDGIITQAHCAAPRRMNGKDYAPTEIVTHFESDYGAATKVTYDKGQITTNVIPNLACTKWFGYRGRILDTPSYDICRTQIDMGIDGDWRRLLTDMQGFHTVTTYGDYLREVGYVLRKVGLAWQNVSEGVKA